MPDFFTQTPNDMYFFFFTISLNTGSLKNASMCMYQPETEMWPMHIWNTQLNTQIKTEVRYSHISVS